MLLKNLQVFYVIVTTPTVGVQSIAIIVPLHMSVCLSVCLFASMFVCPLAYLESRKSNIHQIFYACYLYCNNNKLAYVA